VRSVLKLLFVIVPTAALATGVVVGAARNGDRTDLTVDGDLERDLRLAASTALELAPVPLTTLSAIESPATAEPRRSVRPKRSSSGPRAVRSRTRAVRAAPEPEVVQSPEETPTDVAELAGGTGAEAPVEGGGVALPRPTAIPVSYPGGGEGSGGGTIPVIIPTGGDGGPYDPGPGTVIRGGGGVNDPCRIHAPGSIGRRPDGRPVYRQPRGGGITLGERIRGWPTSQSRPMSIGDRIGAARRAGSQRTSGSIGERVRAGRRR
jgi:hypothetical protein